MLKLQASNTHPITMYCRGSKGRWFTAEEGPKVEKDTWEAPEEWWWPEGCATRELKLNLQLWVWQILKPNDNIERGLLSGTTADSHWYRLLRGENQGEAMQAISEKWELMEEEARGAIKRIWTSGIAPKLQSFLWLVVYRALPTVEGREEWMESMAVAACTFGCYAQWSTLEHALYECWHAKAIWAAMAEWQSVKLGKPYRLTQRFILIMQTTRAEEQQLREVKWWCALRAWFLHSVWSDWVVAVYSTRMKRKPGQVAQTAWYKATQACTATWLSTKVPIGKPRKPPCMELLTLTMVKADATARSGVRWTYSLPSDLLNALERRALPETIGCGDGTT